MAKQRLVLEYDADQPDPELATATLEFCHNGEWLPCDSLSPADIQRIVEVIANADLDW